MIKSLLLKISGSFKLLIITVCIYILFAIFNTQLFFDSLYTFVDLLKKVVPVLVLVFFLMFLSNMVLSSKKIIKILKKESGVLGYILSISFGIISTGPIYMWYPLLADLREKGVKNSLLVTFLYNRAVKIPLLPMMIYYFGLTFVMILTLFMIIFSVINGFFIEKLLTPKK